MKNRLGISDQRFKQLNHYCKGYKKFANGNAIERGYHPDYVLNKAEDYIILECETSTSRKTYLGAMLKAAHYLQGNRTGILVIVLAPKVNTTAVAIANHLKLYYNWIKAKTNLSEIWVIETGHYYCNEIVIKLNTRAFKKVALSVSI